MSAENSPLIQTAGDRFWNVMGTEVPGPSVFPVASIVAAGVGVGVGVATHIAVQDGPLLKSTHEYQQKMPVLHELQDKQASARASVKEIRQLLGTTALPSTKNQLEVASQTYAQKIATIKSEQPVSYHPGVEDNVDFVSSLVLGLGAFYLSSKLLRQRIGRAQAK